MVLYGTCMGSANSHSNHNLPMLLAGGGFKHGQHIAFDPRPGKLSAGEPVRQHVTATRHRDRQVRFCHRNPARPGNGLIPDENPNLLHCHHLDCRFRFLRHGAVGDPVVHFVQTQCLDCHDHETAKGNLDLETLSHDLNDPLIFRRWEKIHDRVRDGEMPPKSKSRGRVRPRYGKAVDALASELTETDLARRGGEGRAKLRRLTRTELDLTIQDVFALPGMSVKQDIPEDGISAGFDKVSEALDISAVQMARYMDMGRFVLDRAIPIGPSHPSPSRCGFTDSTTTSFARPAKRRVRVAEGQETRSRDSIAATSDQG